MSKGFRTKAIHPQTKGNYGQRVHTSRKSARPSISGILPIPPFQYPNWVTSPSASTRISAASSPKNRPSDATRERTDTIGETGAQREKGDPELNSRVGRIESQKPGGCREGIKQEPQVQNADPLTRSYALIRRRRVLREMPSSLAARV